jgi:hypothetical protein
VCPARATWHLIAWRAWLAGCSKRPSETVRDWHRRTLAPAVHTNTLRAFLAGFERAAYGPATPADRSHHHYRIAEATAALVTVDRLRGPAHGSRSATQEAHRWQLS